MPSACALDCNTPHRRKEFATVVMYNLRWNDAVGPKPKAAPNRIFRMEVISTPGEAEASGYVSPNVNTLYGFGFLDLGPQPVIMSMPDSEGRYYTIETAMAKTPSVAAFPPPQAARPARHGQ